MKCSYSDRPISKLIRLILNSSKLTNGDAAQSIGISKAYFNNKMTRNSFSISDLVNIGKACGFNLYLDSGVMRINITEFLNSEGSLHCYKEFKNWLEEMKFKE